MNIEQSFGALFGSGSFVGGIALVIFWMVVAWRAMRAHERIADAWNRANPEPPAQSEMGAGTVRPGAEAVKPCVSCGKMIPKGYTKCLHCGHAQP